MMPSARFRNRHALISGGGTGIGRATALALAREGAAVRIVGPKESELAEVVEKFPDLIRFTVCDIRNETHWKEVIAAESSLDLMVNNAAVSISTEVFDSEAGLWEDVFAVNLHGYLNGCREAARVMKDRGGRIVNISSVLARLCERNGTAYGMAKAAVDQLTRCLAMDLAPYGILVNAVAPGYVDTPMSRASGTNELETEWFQTNFIASGRIPLRRPARPDEIANAVLFLADSENTYITGHVLTVDGGMSITL